MRRGIRSIAIALAVGGVGLAGPAVPAHAQEWVLVAQGVVSGPSINISFVDPLLTGALGAAGGAVCAPKSQGIIVSQLGWREWLEPNSGEIDYEWYASGQAYVTNDCAQSVSANTQICDYAPAGRPPVICSSNTAPARSTTAVAGTYRATSKADLTVPYYVPLSVYQRGESLVKIKVAGSYVDRAGKTVPIPCSETYTHVTPTPMGPIFGETAGPAKCV